jgi:hypothetical protein
MILLREKESRKFATRRARLRMQDRSSWYLHVARDPALAVQSTFLKGGQHRCLFWRAAHLLVHASGAG